MANPNDRVEELGLRLAPLPHHRTCGFPHPAVERSDHIGLARSDGTICSIRFSYIAFFRRFRSRWLLRSTPGVHRSVTASPPVGQPESVTAVVAARCFGALSSFPPDHGLASFLRSSALRSSLLSQSLFATTASADFSRARTRQISSGKNTNFPCAPPDSTVCSLMALDFTVASQLVPAPGLAVRSFSCGRRFASCFFQPHLAVSTLQFGYRYLHRFGRAPFIPIVRAHAEHTSAGVSPAGEGSVPLPVHHLVQRLNLPHRFNYHLL